MPMNGISNGSIRSRPTDHPSPKLDLKLDLSPPPLPTSRSSSSSSLSSSPEMRSTSTSTEEESPNVAAGDDRSGAVMMRLVGCQRCLMYVMLAADVDGPKCPKCKTSGDLIDFLPAGGSNHAGPCSK